jgi:serine/threonine protein kinase
MKYDITELIGDGSFGSVFWAWDKKSGELVAIKKMKSHYHTWEDAMALPEIKCLIQLKHLNIVKLKEVIRSS